MNQAISPSRVAALEKIPAAARRMGVSTTTAYREIAAGRLGPLVKLGERASAFPYRKNDWDNWGNRDTPVKHLPLLALTVKHMPLSLERDWDNWDTSESGRFRTAQRFGKVGGIRPLFAVPPAPTF